MEFLIELTTGIIFECKNTKGTALVNQFLNTLFPNNFNRSKDTNLSKLCNSIL